jgi:LemA protein
MTGLYIVLGATALLALWIVLAYNALVKARNKVDEAWSGIDVQLKRRHDLVPNLVETVKGYAAHEREALQSVTEARAAAVEARDPRSVERAEAKLTSALGAINALAEAYPSCERPRTSSACRPSWPRWRTRSRRRAGSTTRTSSTTTRARSSSRRS